MSDLRNKAVGPCSLCGRTDWWWNSVPLIGFCWGQSGREHVEVRVLPPIRLQPYPPTTKKQRMEYETHVKKQYAMVAQNVVVTLPPDRKAAKAAVQKAKDKQMTWPYPPLPVQQRKIRPRRRGVP